MRDIIKDDRTITGSTPVPEGSDAYRVLTASVYRSTGILGVEITTDDGIPSEPTAGQRITFRSARLVFDASGAITGRRIIAIQPPDFPIDQLVGKVLRFLTPRSDVLVACTERIPEANDA